MIKKKYIAKPNTWFKEGTEVKLIEYLHVDGNGNKYGLFEGIHIDNNKNDTISTEVCAYDEFEIITSSEYYEKHKTKNYI